LQKNPQILPKLSFLPVISNMEAFLVITNQQLLDCRIGHFAAAIGRLDFADTEGPEQFPDRCDIINAHQKFTLDSSQLFGHEAEIVTREHPFTIYRFEAIIRRIDVKEGGRRIIAFNIFLPGQVLDCDL